MSEPTPTDNLITSVRTATGEELKWLERRLTLDMLCALAAIANGRGDHLDWSWMVSEVNRVTAAMRERRAELNIPAE